MDKECCDLMRKWPLTLLRVDTCRSSVQGILIRLERTEKKYNKTSNQNNEILAWKVSLLTFTHLKYLSEKASIKSAVGHAAWLQ